MYMMSNEENLILWITKGEEEAIKYIFDLYYSNMCLYAFTFLKDHDSAKDIVEDIFIQLWLKAKTIDIKTSLKSYLFQSVRNNCIKLIRDQNRRKRAIRHYISYDPEILNPVSREYPISNLILGEIEEKVIKVFESLPPQCKKIFELSRFDNLTYYQISKELNISISTVKTQMSRAFQKFRKELIDYIPLIIMLLMKFL